MRLPKQYQGTSKTGSSVDIWLMKCKISYSSLKLKCDPPKHNSMLLLGESVNGICEFAKDQLLLYSNNSNQILITNDWDVIHQIVDPQIRNTLKHWISPLPQFDAELFPLVLCSGNSCYSLINVKTGSFQLGYIL